MAATHMPTPGGTDADEPVTGADDAEGGGEAGDPLLREPRQGRVLQVQMAEAICTEASSLLRDLGLLGRVPIILAGDFNAKPGDAVHTLLTSGALPASTRELHPRTTDGGKAARKARAAATAAAAVPAASAVAPDGGSAAVADDKAIAPKKPVSKDISLAEEVLLPYRAPTCAGLGPFRSAYAAAHGAEPEITTYRLFGRAAEAAEAAPPEAAAAASPEWVSSGHFSGTLDYIFFANPLAPAPLAPGVPAARIAVVPAGTPALPSEASLLESLAGEDFAALPSSLHPSDHLPLIATFQLAPA